MDDWDSDSREDQLDPLTDDGRLMLSASSVTTFLRCGVQWEYAYVKKVRARPTVKQVLGISAHEAFEHNLLTKQVTKIDLPEDVVLDIFSTAYDRQVYDATYDEDDPPEDAKDQGVKLVRKQHLEIAPSIEPMLVEAPIQFEINGVIWTGTIDFVDGKLRVRDWKTSKRKPSSASNYQLAMTGYALGFRQMTGQIESDIQLDFMVRYKKQDPAYYPVPAGGPVPDRAIHMFAETVARVQELIMAGHFVPNGLQSNACSWCGYREICPFYKR